MNFEELCRRLADMERGDRITFITTETYAATSDGWFLNIRGELRNASGLYEIYRVGDQVAIQEDEGG